MMAATIRTAAGNVVVGGCAPHAGQCAQAAKPVNPTLIHPPTTVQRLGSTSTFQRHRRGRNQYNSPQRCSNTAQEFGGMRKTGVLGACVSRDGGSVLMPVGRETNSRQQFLTVDAGYVPHSRSSLLFNERLLFLASTTHASARRKANHIIT